MKGPRMIDLGVLPAAGADRELPGTAWRPRTHRRSYWTAGLVAALLLITGAAAAPAPPWPIPHFTISATATTGGIYLTEETLLVSERTGDQQAVLTAYRLSDGAVRWEAEGIDGYVWNGVPLLWRTGPDGTWQTHLYDLETGQVIWRGRAGLAAFTADRFVFVYDVSEPPFDGSHTARWPELSLEVVDRYTGETVRRLDGVRQWGVSDQPTGPATLVVAADDHPVTSYDLATGESVATAPEIDLYEDGVLVVAGEVLLVQPREAAHDYTAYDARSLTERWHSEQQGPVWAVQPCGPVLCVHNSHLTAVDPATGEQLWSGQLSEQLYPDDDSQLIQYHPGPPWPPEYLVVEPGDRFASQRLRMAVVRATTGELVADFPGWMSPNTPGVPVRASDPGEWTERPAPILQRYETPPPLSQNPSEEREDSEDRDPPVGRTWFARLHFDPLHLEVLGSVDGGLYGCQALGDYIACLEPDQVRVWRIR